MKGMGKIMVTPVDLIKRGVKCLKWSDMYSSKFSGAATSTLTFKVRDFRQEV